LLFDYFSIENSLISSQSLDELLFVSHFPIEANQFWTDLWAVLPDAIVRLNAELACTGVNPTAWALVRFALDTDQAVQDFYSRLALKPAIAESARRVLQTGRSERTEFEFEIENVHFWMDTWLTPIGEGSELVLAMRDISYLKQSEKRLRNEAERDPGTGLLNHAAFHDQVTRTLRLAQEYGEIPALVLFDLDYLKNINDTYGHRFGDQAIGAVAEALRSVTRAHDLLGRLGGDEFAWLVPNADLETVSQITQRVLTAISSTSIAPNVYLSASAGVAMVESTFEPGDLFDRADAAVYTAKASGRGVVVVAGATDIEYRSRRFDVDHPSDSAPELFMAQDVTTMARAALREWVRVLAASGGCIDLLDEQQEYVQAAAFYRFGHDDWQLSDQIYRLEDYPSTARAIAERRNYTCRVDDPDADPAETALLRDRGFASMLLIPLIAGERVFGIVELFDTRYRTFTADQQRTAIALARHLAVILALLRERS
jgi:diguanylate cyclase (GGDEF)-like protein